MSWYQSLRHRHGRGTQMRRAASLAELHVMRAAHQGQFFTPNEVARTVWSLLEPVLTAPCDRELHLFDNSIGTGRLLQFADPMRHTLSGVDTDAESVAALAEAATAAGFTSDLVTASMADVRPRPRSYDIGLINPPFSLTLQSPHLVPYGCTTWGLYGRNTSALSHAYALHQALDACDIVVAVLFRSYARSLLLEAGPRSRLVALLHLPAGSFESANAQVDTSIAVFDRAIRPDRTVIEQGLLRGKPLPRLPLERSTRDKEHPRLRQRFIEDEGPTIHTPVTGNAQVRIAHCGRKLILKFSCGLVQAKVLNAVLQRPLPRSEDYPPPLSPRPQVLRRAHPGSRSAPAAARAARVTGGAAGADSNLWRRAGGRARTMELPGAPHASTRAAADAVSALDSSERSHVQPGNSVRACQAPHAT